MIDKPTRSPLAKGMDTAKNDAPSERSLALDATVLANEHTFQAWIRTGLAALASGLGIAKFFTESLPLWMLLTIATVLIALSVGAFLLAS